MTLDLTDDAVRALVRLLERAEVFSDATDGSSHHDAVRADINADRRVLRDLHAALTRPQRKAPSCKHPPQNWRRRPGLPGWWCGACEGDVPVSRDALIAAGVHP